MLDDFIVDLDNIDLDIDFDFDIDFNFDDIELLEI